MPQMIIRAPEGAFDTDARQKLATALTAVATRVEQMGEDPRQQFLTFVIIEEIKAGFLYAGGRDPLGDYLPVTVFFHYPEGAIDQVGRELAVKLVHEAIVDAAPKDGRRVVTSVAMTQVDEGTWSGSGEIWRLADFAKYAGYKHLQHLVIAAA